MKAKSIFRFFALLVGAIISPINLSGQLAPIWSQSVDPTASDDEATAITSNSNAIFVAGFDYSASNSNWRIEKRDLTTGNYIPTFGTGGVVFTNPTSSDDFAKGITHDQNAIYVTGIENQCFGCDSKWHIQKRDLNTGGIIWFQISNPSINPDGSNAIAVDTSGVYIVGTVGISFLNWAWRVEKRDLTTGSLIWGHTWDISPLGDTPYSITLDSSGLYVAGADYLAGNAQWRIEKRNLITGSQIWTHTVNPSSLDDVAKSVVCDSSGIYIGGYDINVSGDSQWRIEKRNLSSGLPINSFGSGGVIISNISSGLDEINGMTIDTSGIYAAGIDNTPGNAEWRVEKRDLYTGALTCSVTSDPSPNDDKAFATIVDGSGVYVAGMKYISFGDNEWRIEKYSNSCSIATNIKEISAKAKLRIFPNPAANYIEIDNSENKSVQIFDAQGKLILEKSMMNTNTIDISGLQSGIHFVRHKELNVVQSFLKE
ncbi:MAG: T9SS type A sorting domain-containing protein [Bacteroidetes bacterium]|nr:T9SS type A sorting domain-containing protein [Bacteroidota bacterium]